MTTYREFIRKIRNWALLVLVIFGVWGLAEQASSPLLEVHFINVGQGDAILVDLGSFEVLIDGGPDDKWVPYLKGRVDGPIELLIVTHPDADHIGGLPTVLQLYKVESVWTTAATNTTAAHQAYLSALRNSGASTVTVSCGYTKVFDSPGLKLEVLHPCSLSGNLNNDSLVLRLTYGGVTFLFTGDIEKEGEQALLRRGVLAPVDVLKVAHHGSASSTSDDFVKAVKPKISVISVGKNNYGHPSDQTLSALAGVGTCVWRTDIHGTVVVQVGKDGFSVRPEHDVPLAPIKFTARRSEGNDVLLQWCDIAGNELGFEVKRGPLGSSLTTIAYLPPNTTSFIDKTARPDTEYCYSIAAVGRAGNSEPQTKCIPIKIDYTEVVQRGNYASLTIWTKPGRTWYLEYITPSGRVSTATGLGSKTADATGVITWEWLISGNTSPGIGKLRLYQSIVPVGAPYWEGTIFIISKGG
jgi:beta-lactamase superfamily II metal-dependent hydrolase